MVKHCSRSLQPNTSAEHVCNNTTRTTNAFCHPCNKHSLHIWYVSNTMMGLRNTQVKEAESPSSTTCNLEWLMMKAVNTWISLAWMMPIHQKEKDRGSLTSASDQSHPGPVLLWESHRAPLYFCSMTVKQRSLLHPSLKVIWEINEGYLYSCFDTPQSGRNYYYYCLKGQGLLQGYGHYICLA